MKTLRIFISSPGDVAEERERAKQVIEQLRRRYTGRLELRPVFWEDMPLQGDMSFQEGIDVVLSDHGVGIAIFILWSRLGSPTGPRVIRDDGSEYRSGTEREFDLMLKARAKSGGKQPDILIYTRADESSFEERLRGRVTDDKNDLIRQKKLVETFIQEEFHDVERKTNLRAYHSFDRPVTFSQRLRIHLQELIDPLVEELPEETVWDVAEKGSPFLGLDAFQPCHAPIFFGREDEVLEVRQALKQQACEGQAFVLIAGGSGSGKSSLARAGVLPAVCDFEIDDSVSHWLTLICTPGELGNNPLATFAERLAEVLPHLRSEGEWATVFASDLMTNAEMTVRRGVLPALAQQASPSKQHPRFLLVVDQLEELFSCPHWQEPERRAFAALLEALARSGKVWVLATMRADFLGTVQTQPSLVALRSGGGQYDLLPPDIAALRRLITEPARLAGVRFEAQDGKTVADTILQDAAAHRELLPLISHLMADLFQHRTADQHLTFARYEEVGGVGGALARHADRVFAAPQISEAARAALGSVLRQLVTLSGDDETVFVRQYPLLNSFNAEQRQLVDALISGRLLTTRPDGTVTLAHEVLLRVWLPAQTWVTANADFLRVRARLESRRKQGGLLLEGDPLLDLARPYLNVVGEDQGFTPEQRDLVESSLEAIVASRRRRERTRKRVMASLSVLTLLSLVGVGIAFWQWQRANQAREVAEVQRQKAEAQEAVAIQERQRAEQEKQTAEKQRREAVTQGEIAKQTMEFVTGMFKEIDPASAQGREVTVREVLDKASANLDKAFAKNPAVEWQIRKVLEDIYDKIGRPQQARTHAEAMLRLAKELHGETDHEQVAVSLNSLGTALDALGKNAEALVQIEAALAMMKRLYPKDHAQVALTLNNLAFCLNVLGRSKEALPKYLEALEVRKRLFKGDHADVATSLNSVGMCLNALGRHQEALPLFEQALAMRQRVFKADHPDVATSFNNVASCLNSLGREEEALSKYQESLAMYQRLFKDAHPQVATSLNNVAFCLNTLGRHAEALIQFEEALKMQQQLFQGDHPKTAMALNNLAACLGALEEYEEALQRNEEALAMYQRLYPGDHPEVATSINNVGYSLFQLARYEEAQNRYEEALKMRQRLFKEDHPDVAASMHNVAFGLYQQGKYKEAMPYYLAATKVFQNALGRNHWNTITAFWNMGDCLTSLNQDAMAKSGYEGALVALKSKGLQWVISVSQVTEKSAAEKAGVQEGDVVTQINGTPLFSVSQWQHVMDKLVNQPVTFTLKRGDESYEWQTHSPIDDLEVTRTTLTLEAKKEAP